MRTVWVSKTSFVLFLDNIANMKYIFKSRFNFNFPIVLNLCFNMCFNMLANVIWKWRILSVYWLIFHFCIAPADLNK